MGQRRYAPCGLWIALIATVSIGCVEPGLVPCGDRLCPSNTTCVAGELCASDDQLAACAGLGEGASCTASGRVGRCDRGVCVASGCGNGVIDPGELCDDGNATGGDGCPADCSKLEQCGDAVLDVGEGCDDGNANPADGCDACAATAWTASTLIGGGTSATAMSLAYPSGIAIDRRDNIYVVDGWNWRILRIDVTGVVTTIAGSGQIGYSGDGGPAIIARLNSPRGVAEDGLGTVYIADTNNHRVRRVDAAGIITTVAGTGTGAFSGDDGPATSAELLFPRSIVVDGLGNLFIADAGNNRIRRVDGTTGIITTIAGTGAAAFGGDNGPAINASLRSPRGIAMDRAGNIYIADSTNSRIRRIDTVGVITTVAGGGLATSDGSPATSARLFAPEGVTVDGDGNLYIAETYAFKTRLVAANTGLITTLAGTGTFGYGGDNGPGASAALSYLEGVAVDSIGRVYITDTTNHRMRRVDSTGVIRTVAGTGAVGNNDSVPATAVTLNFPHGAAVSPAGRLFVADTQNHRVLRLEATGMITTIAGNGTFGSTGDGGAATSAQLSDVYGVAFDATGNLYISESMARIRRVDALTGVISTIAGDGTSGFGGDNGPATSAQLSNPNGVAVDALGAVYVADAGNHRIRRIDPGGTITTVAGTGTPGDSGDNGLAIVAELRSPYGVAIDQAGVIYIADTGNHRIRKIDGAGVITTVAGTGLAGYGGDGGAATSAQLDLPRGVAVDGTGTLYIADMTNDRIRKVSAAGVITTIAGSSTSGTSGDAALATAARLTDPRGVTVDQLGNVYITDSGNERIRRIDPAGIILTVVGRMDPEGVGTLATGRLADPRGLVVTPTFTLFAGGTSGTVEIANGSMLEVAAGRYPHAVATGNLARFRSATFGTVRGVAHDAMTNMIYLTEATSNRLHAISMIGANRNAWTIQSLANSAGTANFADGAAQTARFRGATGLYFDASARQLYVADTGNHVIRAIDLSIDIASATVRTIAGTPATLGFSGDGGAATTALLFEPQAITRCPNGDLFIADTGNHRVRRVAAATGTISTVVGAGVATSSGEGAPAFTLPVNAPLGLACDALGNLFVTSTTAVRLLPSDGDGVVDGTGPVQTIYGAAPRDAFPENVTRCLTGIAVVDASTVHVTDSCTGILLELRRASL